MLTNNFILPLLLTISVECMAAILMGYRGRLFFAVITLINLITNPILNFVLLLLSYLRLDAYRTIAVVLLEIIVVLAEWRILSYAFQKRPGRWLLLSVVMNVVSFITGEVILKFYFTPIFFHV